MKNLLSQIKHNVENYVPTLSFRDGQEPIVSAFVEDLKKGITSMYIDGPTGIGKTFIEAVVADAMIGDSKNIKILLLTKASLTKQIQKELKRFLPHRKSTIYSGDQKDLSGEIVVMSYASYRINYKNIHGMFNGLLLDESHKAMGPKTRACITLHKEYAITLGLTASAFYSINKNLKEFLGKLTKKITIKEAIEMNMLCAVELSMLNLGIVFPGKEKGETSKAYDYRIANASIQNGTNNALAHFYANNYHHLGIRSIFFCLTKKQSEDMATRLLEYGVQARVIHSGLGKRARRKMLDSFRKGHFEVLIGMNIPKEGFDDPGVSLSMFCYPAKSLVDILQGNGRPLRLDPNNPDKLAYIIMPNFIGKKGQRFYYEFLEGHSFIQPKDKKKRGKYKRTNKKASTKKVIIPPMVSVSYTHEEFVKITSKVDREIDLAEIKIELSRHGILSRETLSDYGSKKFIATKFEEYYMGSAYVAKILGRRLFEKVSHKHLDEISDKLGWHKPTKKEQIELWKSEFKKHNVDSYLSFVKFGPANLKESKFGRYGYGQAFAGLILNKVVYNVTSKLIPEVCTVLNWEPPTIDEKISDYKLELAKHNITSRKELLICGANKFRDLRFESYRKNGRGFLSLVLGQSVSVYKKDLLLKMADTLGWKD